MRGAGSRRRFLQAGAAAAFGLAAAVPRVRAADCPAPAWPAWHAFEAQFLHEGDRVIDPASPRAHTVSEGQAYALFFALVAGDRGRFERTLRWTEDNLAAGDLAQRLPAWQWGRREDGTWGVLDANSASDADLWLAYCLGEAGRLWRERRYLALASVLAERILREETAELPGLGRSLLPGPQGFAAGAGRWRLNPCYAPPFLMRWFAARSADARWAELRVSSLRVLRESAPRGLAPDWAGYRADTGFDRAPADAADRIGSYDAVRVYLWLGLTDAGDPARAGLLQHFAPMAELVERNGVPPRSVDVFDGTVQGEGPAGFSAALLPFLAACGHGGAARAQAQRLIQQPPAADAYYEQALALFASGWREGRYAFGADGGLLPAWHRCAS
jgi:endo-1,4-beta-D-glucanase Y